MAALHDERTAQPVYAVCRWPLNNSGLRWHGGVTSLTKSGRGTDWPDLVTIVTGLAQLVKETLARPSTQERSNMAAGWPGVRLGGGEQRRREREERGWSSGAVAFA